MKISWPTVLLLMLAVCSASTVLAQSACTCQTLEPGISCEEAPLICDLAELDEYCLSMHSEMTGNGPFPLCGEGGIPHNTHWFSFVAGCTNFTIILAPYNCMGFFGQSGIQVMVLRYGQDGLCPGSTAYPEDFIYCQSLPCINDLWFMHLEDLEIGQRYYLMLDGCNGSVCDVLFIVTPCDLPEIGPWPGDLTGPALVCSDSTYTYSVPRPSGAFTFYWYVDGQEVEISRENTLEINWPGPGSYQLCVDVANDCVGLNETPLPQCMTVEVHPEMSVNITGESELCPGMVIPLDADPGFASYAWSTGEQTPSILINAPGMYGVTVTEVSGCVRSATKWVEALPGPEPAALSNAPLCIGDSLKLDAAPGYDYLWSGPEGFSSAAQAPVIASVDSLSGGWYRLIITDSLGCMGFDSLEVAVYDFPAAELIVLDEQCADSCDGRITLLPREPGYMYAWSDGGESETNDGLCAGLYAVTITSPGGCFTVASAELHAAPPLEVALTLDEHLVLAAVSGGASPYTYLWSSGETTPSAPALPGWIAVTVTDAHGCPQTAELLITRLEDGLAGPAAVRLYPNPAREVCYLEWLSGEDLPVALDYQVYTMQGGLLTSGRWPAGASRHSLSTAGWPAGTYILELLMPAGRLERLRLLVLR